jgi:hypothetical protein
MHVTTLDWIIVVVSIAVSFLPAVLLEKHYVFIGRVVTGLLMLLAASLTFVLDSAKQSFDLMLSVGAGTGLIYLLRWFW